MPHLDPVTDDLSAIQADDLLLNHLGSALPCAAGHLVDDELNALLAWRNEAEAIPMPVLVDVDTAVVLLARATNWWATNTAVKVAALLLFLAVITTVAVALTATDFVGAA